MGNVQTRPITVGDLNFSKYQGEWWEIAKYPTPNLKNYVKTKYLYEYNNCEQKIYVTYTYYLDENKTVEVKGTIVNADKNNPGRLLISFQSISNPNIGQYWVHWTDYSRYAIVGNSARSQLFILARKPYISNDDFSLLKLTVKGLGYNINKLIVSEDNKNINLNYDKSEGCDLNDKSINLNCYKNDESQHIIESCDDDNYYRIDNQELHTNANDKLKKIKSDNILISHESGFWHSS